MQKRRPKLKPIKPTKSEQARIEQLRANGRKGGRPKGTANLITRETANKIAASGTTPLDVMYDNLLFWHNAVQSLAKQVQQLIVDADSEEERAEAFQMLKDLLKARENSQSVAVDMAPYIHARLASITWKPTEAPVDPKDIPDNPTDAAAVYQKLIGGS